LATRENNASCVDAVSPAVHCPALCPALVTVSLMRHRPTAVAVSSALVADSCASITRAHIAAHAGLNHWQFGHVPVWASWHCRGAACHQRSLAPAFNGISLFISQRGVDNNSPQLDASTWPCSNTYGMAWMYLITTPGLYLSDRKLPLLLHPGCPRGKYANMTTTCNDCEKGFYCAGDDYDSTVMYAGRTACPTDMTTVGRRTESIRGCGEHASCLMPLQTASLLFQVLCL
jgi:hypothetical protein